MRKTAAERKTERKLKLQADFIRLEREQFEAVETIVGFRDHILQRYGITLNEDLGRNNIIYRNALLTLTRVTNELEWVKKELTI